MKLSELKNHLGEVAEINILLPKGGFVPKHFHITEAGLITRHFIDCGGTTRLQKSINFQVWVAEDLEHRLAPEKLLKIIAMSENLFNGEDLEIEIEYQEKTIGKYGLDFQNNTFMLTATQTDCLAKENCGIPETKTKLKLADLSTNQSSCCSPGDKCC